MIRGLLRSQLQLIMLFLVIHPGAAVASASGEYPSFQQDTVQVKSQVRKQPVYTTSRIVTSRPVIDGKLDDECWKHGTWAGDYHQYTPNEGAKPTFPTKMNIQYDDRNIYVAFRAFDKEPQKIHRFAGVRDEIVGDMVGINFDSYRDYRTGFEFTITAWGQKVDLVLFNPENWDFNWNAVWKGKVGMEDSAWVAEIEVPLSQLRYSSKDEQVWGLHTWRWIDRFQEESNWEIQSKTGPGILYNYGEFRGIKGLKKSRRLEIMPYILGDLKTVKKEPGNPFTKNGRAWGGNLGLDAKIGLSSNFTIDLTVNPDFGQVESDPSVMNLTAFETFYEEKRPFFLEGLTIFENKFDDQSLFYSRRIGHAPSLSVSPGAGQFVKQPDMTTILDAVKFSGTNSKGLSIGLIQSLTANEYARISNANDLRSSRRVEPLTNYTVARIQKGYNEGTTVIGGMVTSTNRFMNDSSLSFLASDAVTGGLDLLHRWHDKEFFIDARLIGSYVTGSREAIKALQESSARYFQRPGARDYVDYDITRTSLEGLGGKFRIGKGAKGLWRYSTGVTFLSPGLELNDIGYMTSADQINLESEVSYMINKPVSIFRTYRFNLEQFNSWNYKGTYLGSGGHLSVSADFLNQWGIETNFIFHSKAYDTKILRGGYDLLMPSQFMFFGTVRSNQSKKVTGQIEFSYDARSNGSSAVYQVMPQLSARPFSMLRIAVTGTYARNNDELQYVTTIDRSDLFTGKRYILGTIDQTTIGLTFRVDLNLTPEFSVQYYGSPFISKGTYSDFKHITDPDARGYSDRFRVYQDPALVDGKYTLNDYTTDGWPISYSIDNPDFNFHQFRSNLVAKWEYRLGSFIYLVWSSDRTGSNTLAGASMGDSFGYLRSLFPRNIFLIKLNYWFSL